MREAGKRARLQSTRPAGRVVELGSSSASHVMESEATRFKRYLVREFFWELAQHEPLQTCLAGVEQEAVEVLAFAGYDDLRVRVADVVFDIHLTWRKDAPPIIQRVDHVAP